MFFFKVLRIFEFPVNARKGYGEVSLAHLEQQHPPTAINSDNNLCLRTNENQSPAFITSTDRFPFHDYPPGYFIGRPEILSQIDRVHWPMVINP